MRVLPILFNTDMVKAIMDGQKIATRRAVKYKYSNTEMKMRTDKYGTRLIEIQKDVEGETFGKNSDGSTWHKLRGYIEPKPPYKPGDILYVRETFYRDENCIIYKADNPNIIGLRNMQGEDIVIKWTPSIYMHRQDARIWLKVTGVRAERLHDITMPDMIKEGIRAFGCEPCLELNGKCNPQISEDGFCGLDGEMVDLFSELWDSTIKKPDLDRYGWDANPWTWVIEFERCEKLKIKNLGESRKGI